MIRWRRLKAVDSIGVSTMDHLFLVDAAKITSSDSIELQYCFLYPLNAQMSN